MKPKVIAVIGAGVMGSDTALDLAIHKYQVILKDLTEEHLEKSRHWMRRSYTFVKMMKKGGLDCTFEELLSRIRFTTDYDSFGDVEIVLENITEKYETKKALYLELQEICAPNVLFGVDTSCISITKIADLMPRPENVIGMHFMNPVPLKSFVEMIPGRHTSEETLERAKTFLKTINKTYVVVNDMPGFVTNRVLMMTINESIWLVHDKVATARDIDKIFKQGFGHKTGPLATADLIGLDTIANSLMVLYESYNDSKYKPCPLLQQMVDEGLLGVKSGKGFFEY